MPADGCVSPTAVKGAIITVTEGEGAIMKKTVLFILILFMLAGCSPKFKPEVREADEKALKVAEERAGIYNDGLTCSLSDGLVTIDYNQDKPVTGDETVYQFFHGETLSCLLIQGKDISVIEVDDELSRALEGECAFVRIGDALVLVSDDQVVALEKEKVINENMRSKLRKLISKGMMVKLSSIKRNDLVLEINDKDSGIVDDNGKKYNAGRIIIRFTDGDRDQQIKDYAEFCNGTLVYRMRLSNVCVFEFQNKTLAELKDLVKRSTKLDYVASASLDGINELY